MTSTAGALRAWQEVLDTLPGMEQARAALADPAVSVEKARAHLMVALKTSLFVDEDAIREETREAILSWLVRAAEMLCFWLRGGALYELSPSLHALLDRSDIAREMPMELLTLPTPALCIIPPPAEHAPSTGVSAITVFQQAATKSASRRLAIGLHIPGHDGRLVSCQITVSGWQPDSTIRESLEQAEQQNLREIDAAQNPDTGNPETLKSRFEFMRTTLDYIAKVLLYLRLDNAIIREHRPHSAAPRVFSGLGKRKRELKLAEIDRLYDRYIVGPEVLPGATSESSSGTHEVSAHWRRGHFKSQVHGPRNSLRKVIFIAPILVRADKLAAAGL